MTMQQYKLTCANVLLPETERVKGAYGLRVYLAEDVEPMHEALTAAVERLELEAKAARDVMADHPTLTTLDALIAQCREALQ